MLIFGVIKKKKKKKEKKDKKDKEIFKSFLVLGFLLVLVYVFFGGLVFL